MEFSQLFDAKMVLLCLVVCAVVSVIKHLLYGFKSNKFVKTMLLPSLSVLVGGIVGYLTADVNKGLVAGLLSSLVYGRVKSFLQKSEK